MALVTTTQPKILVVDDEEDLVNLIRYNLAQEGYQVFCAYNGREALELACTVWPDVIVLDLMLPDKPGLELCQQIKKELKSMAQRLPRVIMLTARSAERDRIAGFEAGADDYVTKPFSPRELVLRVKAMLDRGSNNVKLSSASTSSKDALSVGAIRIECSAYRVYVGLEELTLTPIEYKILLSLALHLNVVRSREQLLADVWESAATEILDRTVDAHVKRLRSKLLEARDLLQTVRGVGYRLVPPSGASITSKS
jgi:two-component system, OmpR family, phosphate regulon response regulator PhoB